MKRFLIIILFSTLVPLSFAQEKKKVTESDYVNTEVEMADGFRSEGKIYVLTGIILIILLGTVAYLITIDRKVSRLEKDLHNTEE